ncbi:MAG: HEAT repeat domain-containing protein [Kiritimatiellae bacterium]|nr:HEAT repeat domain-containing protein [Kiritimatiellia bacterium]
MAQTSRLMETVAAATLVLLALSGAGIAGIDESFDGAALAPEWQLVAASPGTGGQGTLVPSLADGKLQSQFTIPKDQAVWHGSYLFRDVIWDGDFSIEARLIWKIPARCLPQMALILQDDKGKTAASMGIVKSSLRGGMYPRVAAAGNSLSASSPVPLADTVDVRIERINGMIYCFWNTSLVFQTESRTPVRKAGLSFLVFGGRVQPTDVLAVDYIREPPPAKAPPVMLQAGAGDNIVTNGDFEGGLGHGTMPKGYTSWSSLGWPKKSFLDDKVKHSGKYSLAMGLAPDNSNQKLCQHLATFVPNQLYRLSFWARTDNTRAEQQQVAAGVAMVMVKNGNYYLVSETVTDSEWRFYTSDFISPLDNSYKLALELSVQPRAMRSGMVWFDDVAIVPTTPGQVKLVKEIGNRLANVQRQAVKINDLEVEMHQLIDLIGFDVGDLKTHAILSEAEAAAITNRLGPVLAQIDTGASEARARINEYEKAVLLCRNKPAVSDQDLSGAKAIDAQACQIVDDFARFKSTIAERIAPVKAELAGPAKLLGTKLEQQRLKRQSQAAAEVQSTREGDNLKNMLADLASTNDATRARAALEAGRVEAEKAVPALIKAMSDASYDVRRNAIYALSWIRAKDAVPELMKLAADTKADKWTRRRATQALGQIGDGEALSVLVELLNDNDPAVKENAIHALGWLRDPRAVKPLVELYETEKSRPDDDSATGPFQICGDIMHALGYIGDKSALKIMLAAADPDNNHERRIAREAAFALGMMGDASGLPVLEKLSKNKDIAMQGTALLSQYYLNQPKDTAPGIRQHEFLSHRDNFYWNTENFQRAIGRWACYRSIPKDFGVMARYAEKANINMVFCERYPVQIEPAIMADLGNEIDKAMKLYTEKNIKVAPYFEYWSGLTKTMGSTLVAYYGRFPSFFGVWKEEGIGRPLHPLSTFKNHLQARYTSAQLQELGISLKDAENYTKSRWDTDRTSVESSRTALWTEFYEFNEAQVMENCREVTEWLHGLRKSTAMLIYFSSANFAGSQSLRTYADLSSTVDMNGIEPSYCPLSYDNSFMAEMARDGEVRPIGMEVYAHRSNPPVKTYEAGIWSAALHAQQYYAWSWGQVFKYPGGGNLGASYEMWQSGMWGALERAFADMAMVSPYMIDTDSPHQVGLVISGRNNGVVYRSEHAGTSAGYTRYFASLVGIWEALAQSHIQADAIWAETLTAGKLERYAVLVLPDAKSLAENEEELLRQWVRAGGHLITTGGTSRFDAWGRPRRNYGLGDVFGANFVNEVVRASTNTVKIGKADASLGTMKAGDEISLSTATGYDLVKPTTATVLASWDNGDPGILKNVFGKGTVVMVTSIYPGSRCAWRELRVFPLWRDFEPGVREFFDQSVGSALESSNTARSLAVENCPATVEVVVRTQAGNNRLVVHLLNYKSYQNEAITGVKVNVRMPAPVVKAFYPKDGQVAPCTANGEYATFRVRDFSIHEMIVLEY